VVRGDDLRLPYFSRQRSLQSGGSEKATLGTAGIGTGQYLHRVDSGEVDAVEALIQAGAKIPVNAAGTEEVRAVMRRYSAKQRFS